MKLNTQKLSSLFVVLFSSAITTTASAQTIEFVAGQLGGGWYTMVSGMAKMLEENNKGLQVKVVPGGGTANPSKIEQGQSQLGMGLDVFAKMAVDGSGIYQGKPHKKVMMLGQSFSDNYLHMIRAKNAKLSFEDVFKTKDLRIGVTKAGSSDEMSFRFVMDHYGTSYDKMRAAGTKFFQGDYNELAAAFKNNQVDYIFLILGIPGAAVMDMAQGRDGELIPYPDAILKSFPSKYGFATGTFPATTYPRFQTAAVPTLVMATTLMVSADLPEPLAYNITKTLCENAADLPKIHKSMDVFDCKVAIKNRPVPVHPGALRYYKEKGII